MTCREKLRADNPDWSEAEFTAVINQTCPSGYGYSTVSPLSCERRCLACWDQEIPGEMPTFEHRGEPISKVKDVFEENGGITVVLDEVSEKAKKLLTEPTEKKEHHAPYPNLHVDIGCIIKDSGDRTQFESGAVRDMREGKGRCDLMPLEVVAEIVCEKLGRDPILFDISCFLDKDDEQGTAWLKAALDNFADKAYGGQRTTMFLEVAKHFEEGAKKYGENNWQKGIPAKCYIDSAVRHYLKWLRGDKDEPHDRAFVWNLMCCIWEVDYHHYENVKDENPDKWVRLEDCPIGLFEFGGKLYLKAGSTVVRVNTGTVEPLHPDILVWPIEIEEDE